MILFSCELSAFKFMVLQPCLYMNIRFETLTSIYANGPKGPKWRKRKIKGKIVPEIKLRDDESNFAKYIILILDVEIFFLYSHFSIRISRTFTHYQNWFYSRRHFTEQEAEKWWAENGTKVLERHNVVAL